MKVWAVVLYGRDEFGISLWLTRELAEEMAANLRSIHGDVYQVEELPVRAVAVPADKLA